LVASATINPITPSHITCGSTSILLPLVSSASSFSKIPFCHSGWSINPLAIVGLKTATAGTLNTIACQKSNRL